MDSLHFLKEKSHSKSDLKKILSFEAHIYLGRIGKLSSLSFTVDFEILHLNLILNCPNG